MEWNVKNAVNPNVERQHLNKILKEIQSGYDNLSSQVNGNAAGLENIQTTVTRVINSSLTPGQLATNVTLQGAVSGTSVPVPGQNAVIINTTLNGAFVTEAPIDSRAYWRFQGAWQPVPSAVQNLTTINSNGYVVVDSNGNWRTRNIDTANAANIVVTNPDGDADNTTIDLATVANSGTGSLLAITRDTYGRVTGTKSATITGTAGQINVANGTAAAGLPTISLADVADSGTGTLLATTFDTKGRKTGSRQATADDVPIAKLGSATWDNVQEHINVMNSPGLVEGGGFSDAGSGNLAYSSMRIAIRPTDNDISTLYMADVPAGSVAIPNDSVTRFVGVQYNAGVPNVVVKTSDTWNYDTDFPLGEVANLAGTLYPLFNPFKVGDPITNIIQRFDAQAPLIRAATGGLILSTDGTTRNLAMTAGTVWARLNDYAITARNSPTVPLMRVNPTGGTPPLSFTPGITQWPNTQYLSGTTLTTMTNNRWAVLWVFVNVGSGAWGFAHGQAEYLNSSAASQEQVPAYLTQNFLNQNILVGRLIFEKNATTAIIESAFNRAFSTQAVSNHNQLGGLQGGALNEYYHLTSAQLAQVNSSVQSVTAGTGISVNNTDPRNPIVSANPEQSGVFIGGVELTSSFVSSSAGSAIVPIPGMTFSFVMPSRPVLISFGSTAFYNSPTSSNLAAIILRVNGVDSAQLFFSAAITNYWSQGKQYLLSGVAPGTVINLAWYLNRGPDTFTVFGAATDKPYIYVVTA